MRILGGGDVGEREGEISGGFWEERRMCRRERNGDGRYREDED